MKKLLVMLVLLTAFAAYGSDSESRHRNRDPRGDETGNSLGQPQRTGADKKHYQKGRPHKQQDYRQQQENTPHRQNLFYRYDQQQKEMRKNR